MTSRWAAAVTLAGGLIGAGAAWLTWTVSGSVERNSYASLRAARLLDLEFLTPFRVVWFLIPVAVLVLAVLLLAGADRVAAAVGLGIGVVLVGFGVRMLLSPFAGGVGPWMSCVGGIVATAGAMAVIAQARRPA